MNKMTEKPTMPKTPDPMNDTKLITPEEKFTNELKENFKDNPDHNKIVGFCTGLFDKLSGEKTAELEREIKHLNRMIDIKNLGIGLLKGVFEQNKILWDLSDGMAEVLHKAYVNDLLSDFHKQQLENYNEFKLKMQKQETD